MEVRVMARQGKGIREIAREMGISRNTVRRYLREAGSPTYKVRSPRPTKLDPYKDYLTERVREIEAGEHDESLCDLMNKSTDELKALYNTREIEK